jgi:predicted AlkP superfamily phosphohydrolase/phosphomutase
LGTIKLFVLGLDGATWDVIEPLINSGKLPNLKKIKKDGSYGTLKSTLPPNTIPAWLSMATGKNPGKLGIYDFFKIDCTKSQYQVVTSKEFRKNGSYWDLLNRHGYRTNIINHPFLYPFYEINGIIVGGLGLPENSPKSYPANLAQKLDHLTNDYWTTLPSLPYVPSDKKQFVRDLEELIEKQFLGVHYLIDKDWDLFLHITSSSDLLQHNMWDDWVDIKSIYHNNFLRIWEILDQKIGSLLDRLSDVNILILSDHGFGELNENFLLTKWLYRNGYVKTYSTPQKNNKPSPSVNNSQSLSNKNSFVKNKDRQNSSLKRGGVPDIIDIENSGVIGFSTGSTGSLYINKSAKNRLNLKRQLIRDLKTTGEKYGLEINVYQPYEIYHGCMVDPAPDLIFNIDNFRCNIQTSKMTGKIFSKTVSVKHLSGSHRCEGIFLANGPDIRKGNNIGKISIYDIAPTILHIFNIPIPKDVDGRVLKEIFIRNSEIARRKFRFKDYNQEKINLRIRSSIVK